MFTPQWTPLMRHIALFGASILAAAGCAQAQTSSSTNPFRYMANSLAADESSSAALPFATDSGDAASPAAAAAGAAGAGQSDAASGHWYGVSHLAFEAGAGANTPIGNGGHHLTWGGNFTGGAGLHFGKRFSVLGEYQFVDDKLPGSLIADAGAQGGYAHIWSLTLDPVIDLLPKRTNSAYITGGGGFYRKVTSFTDPEEVEECYYYCVIGTENVVVSHFSSNQGGANIGLGLTHRLGGVYGDGKTKVFAEARYVFLNSPSATSTSYGLGTTEPVPVTLGVRW
jgi:hypothetical protein